MRKSDTGFTLLDLLMMMFWVLCCMLLDVMTRHCLGIATPSSGLLAVFLLGYFVCFVASLILSGKHMRKWATALIFCLPLCVAILFVCFLRHWWEMVFFVDFAFGFYAPVLWLWTFILLSILLDSFPVCSSGKCRGKRDFAVSPSCYYSNEDRPVDGLTEYKCKCGDEYVRRGKRFMALDSERNPHPYKKLVGFHKWADDTDQ